MSLLSTTKRIFAGFGFCKQRNWSECCVFVIFIVCWLTLAMLARGQGPRFTLRPEGGAVVDGLGNFHSFCHFESCSCRVSFYGIAFCVFVQETAFLDFHVWDPSRSCWFVTGSELNTKTQVTSIKQRHAWPTLPSQ